MRQIRQRLGECLTSHANCQRLNPHIRPPRLIDVQSSGPDMVQLRLLDSTKFDPYAALSYCWGASQAIKTTLSSLIAHEAGIPVASLPQTLQDAIRVTREIGIDFLWIDSLYIIQDSPNELAKEVANMSYYYGNALVTLSASVSKSCSEGFLNGKGQPPPYISGPFYFSIQQHGRIENPAYLKFACQNVPVEAIDTRAWTL